MQHFFNAFQRHAAEPSVRGALHYDTGGKYMLEKVDLSKKMTKEEYNEKCNRSSCSLVRL